MRRWCATQSCQASWQQILPLNTVWRLLNVTAAVCLEKLQVAVTWWGRLFATRLSSCLEMYSIAPTAAFMAATACGMPLFLFF